MSKRKASRLEQEATGSELEPYVAKAAKRTRMSCLHHVQAGRAYRFDEEFGLDAYLTG